MSTHKSPLELAIAIIKPFEGCRLKAYKCPANVWTIGYGETLGVKEGDIWTQARAEETLQRRVLQFMNATLEKCPQLFAEPPERLAACASIAYNIGTGAFSASSICRLTARREYTRAANSFLFWNKARGKVLLGLTLRREAERKLYLQGTH